MAKKTKFPITVEQIDGMIRTVRGTRVILDSDLAKIYGVPTFRFNEAIKRNRHRFPEDFMFQLTTEEAAALRSQIAILKRGRGQHRKYRAYAFTEHGALQAANVLRSPRAIQMNTTCATPLDRLHCPFGKRASDRESASQRVRRFLFVDFSS